MSSRIVALVTAGIAAVTLSAAFTVIVTPHPVSVPRCTDAIADAGGTCHGEPLPACPTEDSDDCYWDAATMGNGSGRSFVVEHGIVSYLP